MLRNLIFSLLLVPSLAFAYSTWDTGRFKTRLQVGDGNGSYFTTNILRLPLMQDVTRDGLTPDIGSMFFNIDTFQYQAFDEDGWHPIPSYDFNSPLTLSKGYILASVATNNLTVRLYGYNSLAASQSRPVDIAFRSIQNPDAQYFIAHLADGELPTVTLHSGSSAGCSNATACILYVYAVQTGANGSSSGVKLAISKSIFDESSLQSGTAEASTGTSATVLYADASFSSRPIRLIGRITITEATAGVWATTRTEEVTATVGSMGGGSGGIQTFTSNGSFSVPAGVTRIIVSGCGAGGGGGAGGAYSGSGSSAGTGGGGGEGTPYFTQSIAVSPGDVLTITVGTAGTGGTGGAGSGGAGVAGGTTTVVDGATTYSWLGGAAGLGGVFGNSQVANTPGGAGGSRISTGASGGIGGNTNNTSSSFQGDGTVGTSSNAFAGGTGGVGGGTGTVGPGGGGGGASGLVVGANGKAGQAAQTVPTAPTAAGSCAGGGGGAGASGTGGGSGNIHGGPGGSGGTGSLTISW